VSTFIARLGGGSGTRLAVKDLIDVAGVPTTAGCRAVADGAASAADDAMCMAGARAEERAGRLRLVGKANLHELAYGASGVNDWYGTPRNPLDATLIPGGSSSGSAVAVASGDADIAYGTDTGGSVRIPSACCGTTGLKTTWGRVPLAGVYPLAPSLDTVGPMARDVAGVTAGMRLLEPGFVPAQLANAVIGRLRLPGVAPTIDRAIDAALAAVGMDVVDVDLPDWQPAAHASSVIVKYEAWRANHQLLAERPQQVSAAMTQTLLGARTATSAQAAGAREFQRRWQQRLARVFERVEVIATCSLADFPPPLDRPERLQVRTRPVNLAGVPALALPVPVPGSRMPAGLQLIGPWGSEERLVGAGALIEAAVS
jgi:amidase